ncbi:MAG: DUF262 domain-containing protein, partial [Chthonomonadales bacterium]
SLDSLFKEKIFRIPDYQRGYAWQREQLKAFWEDLVNLSSDRSHYTGVLTLKQVPISEVPETSKEYWLVRDHSYNVYHVVDGQQRLTTFMIFLQAFVDFVKGLPANVGRPDEEVYITDTLSIAAMRDRFLFKTKPTGDQFRTYKFGYERDNPSYEYMRYKIFGEVGGGLSHETFYTLNLSNAKKYFESQLANLYAMSGQRGLNSIYSKLTRQFMFNQYVIRDEFDVFVAFETMNNRGKRLSDLELLKNRLIYLTTLFGDSILDSASRASMRNNINDAWKVVYHQLGRNKSHPLNDDDFLRAHWMMFFKYTRLTGRDYIRFLLEEQFTPKRVHEQKEVDVDLEEIGELTIDMGGDEVEEASEPQPQLTSVRLQPTDIDKYVHSLKESAVHWFNTFHPDLAVSLTSDERVWIDRLNRIGIGYFRPLVMSVLKNVGLEADRIRVFKKIERFIFFMFRISGSYASAGSSEFINFARVLDSGETTIEIIIARLDEWVSYTFHSDGSIRIDDFYNLLFKRFKSGQGYYGWPALQYFLYEYETSLLDQSVQQKITWGDLLKSKADKISIEHIYPQSEGVGWTNQFARFDAVQKARYCGSLGNLLLLSMSINSSLQNAGFEEKKNVKHDGTGRRIRNGYSDGSHSEIEVAAYDQWGPTEIRSRGIKLLKFMEHRWDIHFQSDADMEKLLFLDEYEATS